MKIEYKYSYLKTQDYKAIEQGIATLAAYSIRLEQYVTEEEKKANAQKVKTYSTADWIAECAAIKKMLSEQNVFALSALENAGIVLGQYHGNLKDWLHRPYDLWFWCNTVDGEPQLDYVTLTVNKEKTLEQQAELIRRASDILESISTENICAAIQHKAIYDKQRLNEFAERFYEQHKGKYITNGCCYGRIVEIDPKRNSGYRCAFMKKYAKTHGICLSEEEIFALSLLNAA